MNRQQVLDCYYAPTTVPPLSLSLLPLMHSFPPSFSLSLYTHTLLNTHLFLPRFLSLFLTDIVLTLFLFSTVNFVSSLQDVPPLLYSFTNTFSLSERSFPFFPYLFFPTYNLSLFDSIVLVSNDLTTISLYFLLLYLILILPSLSISFLSSSIYLSFSCSTTFLCIPSIPSLNLSISLIFSSIYHSYSRSTGSLYLYFTVFLCPALQPFYVYLPF